MDQRIDRIEGKLDVIVDKLSDLNVTLARNTQSLEIHEKRTDIAEQKLDSYEKRMDKMDNHVRLVNFVVFKVVPAAAAVVWFLYKVGAIKTFS